MWMLRLNDMRSANVETMNSVAISRSAEELKAFVLANKVPDYKDGSWHKVFRQGGPLEWFNPPIFEAESFVEIMSLEQAIENTKRNYEKQLEGLILV